MITDRQEAIDWAMARHRAGETKGLSLERVTDELTFDGEVAFSFPVAFRILQDGVVIADVKMR